MDNKLEKLISAIMKEAEADGEPVTYEEAKEMAEMEIKANKDCKNYVQGDKPRKKVERERKVDAEKGAILDQITHLLEDSLKAEIISTKTETEVDFTYNNNHYTVKLTKHRPPKKQAVSQNKRGN